MTNNVNKRKKVDSCDKCAVYGLIEITFSGRYEPSPETPNNFAKSRVRICLVVLKSSNVLQINIQKSIIIVTDVSI